jgi:hypothetical protein
MSHSLGLVATSLVFVLCAPLVVVLARGIYSFLFRPGKSLAELAVRYPRTDSAVPRLSHFRSAKLPAMTDFATAIGFGEDGMTVRYHGLFRSLPDIVIPWQNLRIDLDFGFIVVVEVVPERTQFLFLLGAFERDDVRRIRAGGIAKPKSS